MIKTQWMTLGFIVFMVHAVVIYDLAVYWLCGNPSTISRVALYLSLRHPLLMPIVCFSAGVLIGHLFLYQIVRN